MKTKSEMLDLMVGIYFMRVQQNISTRLSFLEGKLVLIAQLITQKKTIPEKGKKNDSNSSEINDYEEYLDLHERCSLTDGPLTEEAIQETTKNNKKEIEGFQQRREEFKERIKKSLEEELKEEPVQPPDYRSGKITLCVGPMYTYNLSPNSRILLETMKAMYPIEQHSPGKTTVLEKETPLDILKLNKILVPDDSHQWLRLETSVDDDNCGCVKVSNPNKYLVANSQSTENLRQRQGTARSLIVPCRTRGV